MQFILPSEKAREQACGDFFGMLIAGVPFTVCAIIFSPEANKIAACTTLILACRIMWIIMATYAGFSLLRLFLTCCFEKQGILHTVLWLIRTLILLAELGAFIFLIIAYAGVTNKCGRLSTLALAYIIIFGIGIGILILLIIVALACLQEGKGGGYFTVSQRDS